MVLHELQISDLLPHEIWTNQSSRVLPVSAVRVEDAMFQKLSSSLSAEFFDGQSQRTKWLK